MPPETEAAGLDSLLDVDRLVHEPARLALLAHLSVLQSADFVYLMRQTGLTQGNLSSHLSKLEQAGYVTVTKEFAGKRPRTSVSLSDRGATAFEEYVETMRSTLDRLGR